MKLYEIVTPEITTQQMTKKFDTVRMNTRMKQFAKANKFPDGVGAYATGKVSPREPHEFHKVSNMPSNLKVDAYYHYVQAILPYMDSNPYFPKIYSISIKRDKSGRTKPKYKMETLHHATKFSVEVLMSVGNNIFDGFDDSCTTSFNENVRSDHAWLFMRHLIKWVIIHGTMDGCTYAGYEVNLTLTDKYLLQAAKIIRDVLQSNLHFELDLNPDNIMVRMSPHGPHLVITDPLSDGGKSLVGGKGSFGLQF